MKSTKTTKTTKMTKLILWLFLMALVASGCGGSSGSPGGSVGLPTGSISGRVSIELLDMQPGNTQGLMVAVKERPDLTAHVTAAGTYTIASVPPGIYTVVLDMPPDPPGGVFAAQPSGGAWPQVKVLTGVPTVNVDFKLEAIPLPPTW